MDLRELADRLDALLPVKGKRIALAWSEEAGGVYELLRRDSVCERVGPLRVWEWGTTAHVSMARGDRAIDGGLSLGATRDREDARFASYVEGLVLALRELVARENPRVVEHWAPGWIDVRLPIGVLPIEASALQYRDYFLRPAWLGWLVAVPAKPIPWVRAPATAVLGADGRLDVRLLFPWIRRHLPRTFVDRRWDDRMRRSALAPVRVLSAIHTLDAMVGGNGFEVYLAQEAGVMVREVHAGLGAIGATRMLRVMERGIALAERQGAEFTRERDQRWLDAFDDPAESWIEVDRGDEGSFALLESEVIPAAQRYTEAHREVLIDAGS